MDSPISECIVPSIQIFIYPLFSLDIYEDRWVWFAGWQDFGPGFNLTNQFNIIQVEYYASLDMTPELPVS